MAFELFDRRRRVGVPLDPDGRTVHTIDGRRRRWCVQCRRPLWLQTSQRTGVCIDCRRDPEMRGNNPHALELWDA